MLMRQTLATPIVGMSITESSVCFWLTEVVSALRMPQGHSREPHPLGDTPCVEQANHI